MAFKYIVNELNRPSNATVQEFNDNVYSLIDKELQGKELIPVIMIRGDVSPIIESYIVKN
jgi:hypothetical protein